MKKTERLNDGKPDIVEAKYVNSIGIKGRVPAKQHKEYDKLDKGSKEMTLLPPDRQFP